MKVFQIYFDDSQRGGLDYTPFPNEDCTVYFENSVIKQLVESALGVSTDRQLTLAEIRNLPGVDRYVNRIELARLASEGT